MAKQILSEEFRRMQKLAGLIIEGETDFSFKNKEDVKEAWQEIYDNVLDNMSSLEKIDNEETAGPYGDKAGEKADDIFLTKYGISYLDALDKF